MLLLPLLGAIFTLVAIQILDPIEYPNHDFFTFWLSGHLVFSGQNPYLADVWIGGHHQFGATWIPNRTFIYPLPLAQLFAPLGLLPLYQAFVVWDILSQFMIVSSVALLLRSYPMELSKKFLLPLIVGIALFRPTILTLTNGQLSAALLLLIVFTIYFWERGKWWQGSIFLPFLALKPNLGVPIIILLSLYLLFQKQIMALIAEALSGLALLLLGLLQNPNWILEFWKAGNNKLAEMFGFSPTIWGISAFFCRYERNCTLLYGGLAGLLLFAGFIFLITRSSLSPALLVSLMVSVVLLLTPYTWPYDQLLLLIPIVTIMMRLAQAGAPFLPTALILIMVDILAFILLGVGMVILREFWNAIIPLSVFILLAWYLLRKKPEAILNSQHD